MDFLRMAIKCAMEKPKQNKCVFYLSRILFLHSLLFHVVSRSNNWSNVLNDTMYNLSFSTILISWSILFICYIALIVVLFFTENLAQPNLSQWTVHHQPCHLQVSSFRWVVTFPCPPSANHLTYIANPLLPNVNHREKRRRKLNELPPNLLIIQSSHLHHTHIG